MVQGISNPEIDLPEIPVLGQTERVQSVAVPRIKSFEEQVSNTKKFFQNSKAIVKKPQNEGLTRKVTMIMQKIPFGLKKI